MLYPLSYVPLISVSIAPLLGILHLDEAYAYFWLSAVFFAIWLECRIQ
jgi:hypothetical protein